LASILQARATSPTESPVSKRLRAFILKARGNFLRDEIVTFPLFDILEFERARRAFPEAILQAAL
jgi:hypothetical protein